VIWQVAARRSTYKMLDKRSALYKAKRKIEKAKAQVRAKVEPPFRVIKRQFGYTKVRFRGLVRNTAQLVTLFALSNLWMARRHLLASAERCACNAENGRRKVLATAESTEMSG
jgi:IS5 family transposase